MGAENRENGKLRIENRGFEIGGMMATTLPYFKEVKCHLRQVDRNLWELTEPHLLYLDDTQANHYLKVMQDQSYSKSFHNETVQLIEEHLDELFNTKARAVSLIDLGPGYPDKTLPMAQFLKERSTDVYYYPVDVSQRYLNISETEMHRFCKEVMPINALFELARKRVPKEAYERPAYVVIGLTFMNFPHGYILKLLKQLAGPKNGRVIFASELITSQNTIDDILNAYRGQAMQAFTFGPLRHLGYRDDLSVFSPVFQAHRVEHRFILHQTLSDVPINMGDTVITAVSYRYTIEEITKILNDNFGDGKIWCSASNKTALLMGEARTK